MFRCGGWEARRPGGQAPIELDGDGAWIDGLRALCAAAWSGEQVTPELADAALKALGQPGRSPAIAVDGRAALTRLWSAGR